MDLLHEYRIRDENPIRVEVVLSESVLVGDWYETAGAVVLEDLNRARVGAPILVAGVPRVVIRFRAQLNAGRPEHTWIEFVDAYPAE